VARAEPTRTGAPPSTVVSPKASRKVQPPSGPILALVGSRSSVALEQARLLAQEPGVESFVLDPGMLLEGDGGGEWVRAAAEVGRALDAGRDAVLRARPVEGEVDHSALTREIIAKFPKILAALAK